MTKSLDRDLPREEVAPAEPARPVPTATEAEPAPGPGWGLPLAVLIVGMFMSVLDLSIVNVAIPSIRRDLGASIESVQWISTAYRSSRLRSPTAAAPSTPSRSA